MLRTSMDKLVEQFLKDVETFCEEFGITESTLGTYAVSNGTFFKRIRAGGTFSGKSYDRVQRFMAVNREAATKGKRGLTVDEILS